jgi:hypothetical protein
MRKIPRRYATQEVVVNNVGAIHAVEILCSFLLAQIPPPEASGGTAGCLRRGYLAKGKVRRRLAGR